ncbi:Acyl-CoA-binding domain-containing protein 3 [Coccomyxa viridis]|uniref:Acyl-CoA-binding domain-containing protein 3 n=1 Tax=Coccomyxa viridis TaxID=1274662 RepID=A0AAV1IHP1_9CHLO|nr:Acyl-CoA-binding domain-containing protein 3 [Coccomyxa viridis]
MGVQEDFDKAAEEAKGLPDGTSNDDKLSLYGLFKQGTVGDVDTGKPGIFDQKGRAKWDAWNAKKGMEKETAQKEYIALVRSLQEKYAK